MDPDRPRWTASSPPYAGCGRCGTRPGNLPTGLDRALASPACSGLVSSPAPAGTARAVRARPGGSMAWPACSSTAMVTLIALHCATGRHRGPVPAPCAPNRRRAHVPWRSPLRARAPSSGAAQLHVQPAATFRLDARPRAGHAAACEAELVLWVRAAPVAADSASTCGWCRRTPAGCGSRALFERLGLRGNSPGPSRPSASRFPLDSRLFPLTGGVRPDVGRRAAWFQVPDRGLLGSAESPRRRSARPSSSDHSSRY